MQTVPLTAHIRDKKNSAQALRRKDIIPAIVYGKEHEAMPLQLEYQDFRKAFIKAGSSQIIDLSIEGKKKIPVLVHEVQYHPLKGTISHVDFLGVNLKKEVTTHVPVHFVGVAPAVKDLGGILTTIKHELMVRCLPMNIPQAFEVDISSLVQFSSSIHVKEVKVLEGVQIMDNAEDVVVTVTAPRVEEEAAPVTLEGTAAALPAEGAEGAAAPAESEKKEGEAKK